MDRSIEWPSGALWRDLRSSWESGEIQTPGRVRRREARRHWGSPRSPGAPEPTSARALARLEALYDVGNAPTQLDYSSGLPSDARIVITGGSGFIGTTLVAAYRGSGVSVLNVDSMPPRNQADADLWKPVDITKRASVEAASRNSVPRTCSTLPLGLTCSVNNSPTMRANQRGVHVVLAALAEQSRMRRVVATSSRMVCRTGYQPVSDLDYCPTNAYGASKVETERLVRTTDLPWVLARPTSIWGPWFDVPYRDFFLSVARGRYVHPAGRRIEKSFGFVGNTTWQLHKLMQPLRTMLWDGNVLSRGRSADRGARPCRADQPRTGTPEAQSGPDADAARPRAHRRPHRAHRPPSPAHQFQACESPYHDDSRSRSTCDVARQPSIRS